jgi:predicted DNA-binding transcriptional regulator YafY
MQGIQQYKSRGDAGIRIERLMQIITIITHHPKGQALTKERLAEELEVNEKTIQRDIKYLNDRFSYQIEYDKKGHSWKMLESPTIPHIHLTNEEIFSLLLASVLVENTPFFKNASAHRAFDKILSGLGPHWRELAQEWRESFLPTAASSRTPQPAIVSHLQKAIQNRNTVLLDYDSRSSGRRDRLFAPYAFNMRGAICYVHGYLLDKGHFVSLATDRIYSIEDKASFERDETAWSLYQSQRGVGGFSDGTAVSVQVRFAPEVAQNVKEQDWPDTLELIQDPDGSVWLMGTTSTLEFFLPELLRWRSLLFVHGGDTLRNAYESEIAAMSNGQQNSFYPPRNISKQISGGHDAVPQEAE